MQRTSVAALAAMTIGSCGDGPGPSAEEAARQWVAVVNGRDWQAACELTVSAGASCEDDLRRTYGDARLKFDGPAVDGGGLGPGEEYFSVTGAAGSTIFLTAVPKGDGYGVRIEAVVTGP